MTMDKVSSNELLPCPFCGCDAEICEAEECGDGAYVVACLEPTCSASSAVIFACGDDPRPLLMERWNRRADVAPVANGTSRYPVSDDVLKQAIVGYAAWERSARMIGNVSAGDLDMLLRELFSRRRTETPAERQP